jgi:hypothetical protein
MDLYLWTLLLGAAGLGVMALSGLGARGHGGAPAHGHAHAGGHVHAHVGHAHVLAHKQGATHHGHAAASRTVSGRDMASRTFWAITSPRFVFSGLLGFGTTGELLRPVLGDPWLILAAVGGGVLLERALVTPLWNFAMRFASAPAQTLESAITDEATAVTSFDANGQGIVSVEVDGQIVQCLATLRPDDRTLGARIHAGQRVRIEDVNAATNQCTVSIL